MGCWHDGWGFQSPFFLLTKTLSARITHCEIYASFSAWNPETWHPKNTFFTTDWKLIDQRFPSTVCPFEGLPTKWSIFFPRSVAIYKLAASQSWVDIREKMYIYNSIQQKRGSNFPLAASCKQREERWHSYKRNGDVTAHHFPLRDDETLDFFILFVLAELDSELPESQSRVACFSHQSRIQTIQTRVLVVWCVPTRWSARSPGNRPTSTDTKRLSLYYMGGMFGISCRCCSFASSLNVLRMTWAKTFKNRLFFVWWCSTWARGIITFSCLSSVLLLLMLPLLSDVKENGKCVIQKFLQDIYRRVC